MLLFAPIVSVKAQLPAENFNNSQLPAGWQSVVNTGTCAWDTFTADVPLGEDFESTALIFDDGACGKDAAPSNVSIVSATYDVSTVSPLQLSFEIGLNTFEMTEKLTLEVYDGSDWQLIDTFRGSYNPFLYRVDVTAYANANFRVRWTYDDAGEWSFYAGIDNFKLSQEETPVPPQSTCATAPEIVPGTTQVNTIERGDPPASCYNLQGRGGAWFKYTATMDGVATVSSEFPENGMIDTRVSILQGACGDLKCIAQNDDIGGSSLFSEISFLINDGEEYYIAWDDYNNNSGFDFSLTEGEESCVAGESISINFSDRKGFQTCQRTIDADGDGNSWTASGADFKKNGTITYFAQNASNVDTAKEDYLFSPKLTLDKNTTYTINFTYNGANSTTDLANENLEVLIANTSEATADMTSIYKKEGIVQEGETGEEYDRATRITREFSPTVSGTYYLTFKTTSPAPSGFLLLFDYSLETKLGMDDLAAAKVDQFYDKRSQELKLEAQQSLKHIKIYNMSGQLLIDRGLQGLKENISLAHFSDGIYVCFVQTEEGVKRFKLLKR